VTSFVTQFINRLRDQMSDFIDGKMVSIIPTHHPIHHLFTIISTSQLLV